MAGVAEAAAATTDYTVWFQVILAFVIMGAYCGALGWVLYVASKKDQPNADKWIDVFKSGFLLLGGGVTTLIGYYFATKGTADTAARVAATVAESVIRSMPKQ
jgi:H+/Cl- antiporter ClcA